MLVIPTGMAFHSDDANALSNLQGEAQPSRLRVSFQAGAVPIDTYATLAEIMSTRNRPDLH